jgi:hypothetical protein
MPLKEPAGKTRMFDALLKSKVLSYFDHHLRKRVETEDSEVPDDELMKQVSRDLGL